MYVFVELSSMVFLHEESSSELICENISSGFILCKHIYMWFIYTYIHIQMYVYLKLTWIVFLHKWSSSELTCENVSSGFIFRKRATNSRALLRKSTCENVSCNVSTQDSILYCDLMWCPPERWGAGVETQKNVWGEIGGWGRVPCNEPYAPSLSTIYDGA